MTSSPHIIAIDAMSGDLGPSVTLPGVARAAKGLVGRKVRFLLCGDEAQIVQALKKLPELQGKCEIRHAEGVVAMDAKPAHAMRRGKGTSMWVAIEAVKLGEAHAAVSAGNTGALMAMSRLILRMAADLDRPAIAAMWPSVKGAATVLDVGANVRCDAEMLVEFAIMGEAFHRAVHGVEKPTVGLLNIGSEDQKGHEEIQGAHKLLREGHLPLTYYGFVEGNDISHHLVDVVVTDGFTGNIALKTAEGTAKFLGGEMRSAFTSSLLTKLGALIGRSALRRMSRRLDPNTINGGPLLGLNGLVVKSHGGANADGFGNAIKVAADLVQSPFTDEIRTNMEKLSVVLSDTEQAGAEI